MSQPDASLGAASNHLTEASDRVIHFLLSELAESIKTHLSNATTGMIGISDDDRKSRADTLALSLDLATEDALLDSLRTEMRIVELRYNREPDQIDKLVALDDALKTGRQAVGTELKKNLLPMLLPIAKDDPLLRQKSEARKPLVNDVSGENLLRHVGRISACLVNLEAYKGRVLRSIMTKEGKPLGEEWETVARDIEAKHSSR